MLFNSIDFLFFLPVVLAIYYCLNLRAQNVWLLLASWFFYGYWDWRFLSLLWISTVVDFYCGRGIQNAASEVQKKRLLMVSLFTNLSILGFFKYFNFFVDSAVSVLGMFGIASPGIALHILLPMGISFYTFQTMAYTIDVYRGRQKATNSILNFALYVSYFPQLVAGPIERAGHLIPQLETRRRVGARRIADGLILILIGFFKKIAVADVVAVGANQIFSDPGQYNGFTLLLGVYLFAVQIYCDFSGYTDIARGTSKLIGIDLMENFQSPYFSSSITEFWRRWHISLSAWLRDYLYIPLGGNRHGTFNTYRNLMLTMLLGGLWHGASWNFVIWGGLHGLYLVVHKLGMTYLGTGGGRKGAWKKETLRQYEGEDESKRVEHAEPLASRLFGRAKKLVNIVLTFHLVCFTWIFFRSDSFDTTRAYIAGLMDFHSFSIGIDIWLILRAIVPVIMLFFIEIMQTRKESHTFARTYPFWKEALFFLALLLIIILFGSFDEEVPFIYFQF